MPQRAFVTNDNANKARMAKVRFIENPCEFYEYTFSLPKAKSPGGVPGQISINSRARLLRASGYDCEQQSPRVLTEGESYIGDSRSRRE
jgi:hypothetical protein